MGILDNFKAFIHSITTEDHYASYDSPYKNSVINNSSNIVGGNNSSSRLHELNRLTTVNTSSNSLIESPGNNGSSTNVGYRPGLRTSNLNSSSDLPLQTLNAQGQPPLPSIDSLWDQIESWLEEEYPELEDNLNDGVTTADLNEFENDLGCGSLPVEFRQFYKRHDGQFRGGKPTGLILGLVLLDLESIAEEYAIWAKVSERLEKQQYILQHIQQQGKQDTSSTAAAAVSKVNNNFMANQRSIPPNSIQPYYSHRSWIPIVKDNCGNQIALDLSPGSNGTWGQIIIFGRDFDTKLVIAQSFQEFIFHFVTDLENGNFQIDQNADKDSYGYLEISRNDDDYMIGDEEEDQGELSFFDRDGKEFGKSVKGKMSYLEVFKRRSLKKYGLAENFSTSFTPHRVIKQPVDTDSVNPLRSQTPVSSAPSTSAVKSSSPLISLESSAKVTLPKETLIGENSVDDQKVESETMKENTEAADEEDEPVNKEASENEEKQSEQAQTDNDVDEENENIKTAIETTAEESNEKQDDTDESK